MGKNISNFYYVETETKIGEFVYDNINVLNKRNICNEEFIKMLNSGNICEHDRESYDDKYDTEVIAGEEKQDENLRLYIPVTIKVYNKQESNSNVYKSTQNIYKIPIIRNRIMLTDNKYEMSDVYPNNYNTMLEPANELNTRKLTTTRSMFYNCSKMKKLNTSNFNTSNVTDMSNMFCNCQSLTTLDVSNFNTSNVTNMYYMFHNCQSLTTLDVSKWDTSKVTDMSFMFNNCNSLTTLDVSKWNTSNVTNMRRMFVNCYNLTTLDVSNFNTSKVANMGFMFKDCNSLTSLNLNNFKVNAYKDISGIIAGCTSLTPSTLKMDSFKNIKFCETNGLCCGFKSQAMVDYIFSIIDTSNSSSFKGMFESLDIKDFVVPNINFDVKEINTLGMFAGSKMENLDLSKWDTSNVVNMEGMFYNCDSLTTLNISNWDTSNVTDMGKWGWICNDYLGENGGMFENCTNLTTITGIIDMSSCVEYDNMFRNCNKLTGVKLKNVPKNFNASKAGLKEGQYTIVS